MLLPTGQDDRSMTAAPIMFCNFSSRMVQRSQSQVSVAKGNDPYPSRIGNVIVRDGCRNDGYVGMKNAFAGADRRFAIQAVCAQGDHDSFSIFYSFP